MGFLGPAEWQAVFLSAKVAFWATLFMAPVALFTAYALVRWEFPGKAIVNGLAHLPLILPPVVTGYLLLVVFGTQGFIGQHLKELGIVLAFRWSGAALAAAVMAFPLMLRALRLSLEAVDQRLEQAAATLGASPVRVFTTVTLPLMLPGLLTGGILAFAKALGEFGATITFVGNIPGQTQTIPSAIYALLQVPGAEASVGRMVLLSVLIALLALFLSEVFARRMQRRLDGL
ncbi:molybdate ABC transporter permease subunit [Epibacterium sp. SM1969]|uniref:Molybdenum transport system permease n=1 Tax=Tritonibacter aquimaris TaxID=2663379 RepID=A0A844AN27_9RHOB|nr:molybdate ABC transporter permease subunit [Tritonibacter aquimaris]MQY43870.1 molybdate ABC transporter permease subunit [Tritonibacter aquimaris]